MKHTELKYTYHWLKPEPLKFELPNVWRERAMLFNPEWGGDRDWMPRPEPWKIPTIRWFTGGSFYTFKAGPMQSLVAHAVIETIDEIHEANRQPHLIVMPLDYWNLVISDLPGHLSVGSSWEGRQLFGYRVELSQRDFYLIDDTGTVWK